MLEGRQALDLALDLARMPTLANAMRAGPLPPDTLVVIRIAAGCSRTSGEAVKATGLKSSTIREACLLYLQEILLASNSDSHRVLGVQPGASRNVMREHMRWLLKWLHPDGNQNDWESVFAERVIKAWREVGAGKRSQKDIRSGEHVPSHSIARSQSSYLPVQRWVALPLNSRLPSDGKRRRIVVVSLVFFLGLAIALVSAFAPNFVFCSDATQSAAQGDLK